MIIEGLYFEDLELVKTINSLWQVLEGSLSEV